MHKTEEKLMIGDFFLLNFWLQRPNEDKDIENKTKDIRQLGLARLSIYNLTRRSSLPSGAGGGVAWQNVSRRKVLSRPLTCARCVAPTKQPENLVET